MGDEFLPAPFKGLFSHCVDEPAGGDPPSDQDGLWFVERNEGEAATIQPVGPSFVPTGKREIIDTDVLMRDYCPEPALYQKKVRPQMERMDKALDRGDALREEGQFQRAEAQYDTALSLDENNVRACFGIGICFVRKNDKEKAVLTLEKLLTLEAAFDARYKRLYNEFGIALRKMNMFDEALRFYEKGAEAAADDDHLMFNISRAFYAKDDFDQSLTFLDKALTINPKLTPAKRMKQHLLKAHPELEGQAAPAPPPPKAEATPPDDETPDMDAVHLDSRDAAPAPAPRKSADTDEAGGADEPGDTPSA